MKKFLILIFLTSSYFNYADEKVTVANLTVEELTNIVRAILQESLQKCLVTGSMKGRAKVSLAVVGSVEAKMECNFEDIEEFEE